MQYIHEKLPYYSQWVSRDLVKDIVSGHMEAKEDHLWELSGAENPEEYEYWSRNICGIACLKMILESLNIPSHELILMAKECQKYGGFVLKKTEIDGLFYKPFLNYIKNKYMLRGLILSPLTIVNIIDETRKGNYVIVSVHWSIRIPDSEYVGNKGGHLVIISGFDITDNILYIHNPSGISKNTQEYVEVSIPIFNKYFAGRGMVIFKP